MADKKEFNFEINFDVPSFIIGIIITSVMFGMITSLVLLLLPVLLFWKRKNIKINKEWGDS